MRVLMTGGGTGGHVYPALAIAELIKTNLPHAEIAFVGTERGIEHKLVPAAGYRLYPIRIQGIRRSLSLSNLKTAYYVMTSPAKAKKIIREFKPDIVIGTGGYVCWPLLKAAAAMGIPTMVHESNALPGMAVKQLQKKIDVILTNFEETKALLTAQEKVVNVGNPLRNACGTIDRAEARARLGIPDSIRFVILSFGGSLGAPALNRAALDLMEGFSCRHEDVMQIHASGATHYETVRAEFEQRGLQSCERTVLRDYIHDMPLYMAAADLVICRAGAMTLTELARMGKPAILIPSPHVTDNHQYKNAKVLYDAGAAELIEEAKLDAESVCAAVADIYADGERRYEMSRNIRRFGRDDAGRRIYEEIQFLLHRKQVIVEK